MPERNALYYGDNLDVLRRYIPDGVVDLVYLDPPFNSDQTYNVLFAERSGRRSESQVQAFEDTWHWDDAAGRAFHQTVEHGPPAVAQALRAFQELLGDNDMLAYLSMMAPRLVELHRVLKETGSVYLHCDPTASAHLRLLLDAVFSPINFRSEIIWKRTFSHGNVGRNYGAVFDTLLFYTRGANYTWNQQYTQFDATYVAETFRFKDPDGRQWQSVTLRNPGVRPNLRYPYIASNGITYQPHPNGWACDMQRMKKYDRENRLHFPTKPTGALRLKMYIDESPGIKLQNIWDDLPAIGSRAAERLGYPTQKPEALLERIVNASSNPGDVVLDPFCGCGTAVAVAEQLGRRWIGIDITHLAVGLIKHRLVSAFGQRVEERFVVVGEPVDLDGARALAAQDAFQFQAWALGLVGARAAGQTRKGADHGIDGRLYFHDDGAVGKSKLVVLQVKSGRVSVRDVRDLRGVMEREGAVMAALLTLEEPTGPMRGECASAGFYTTPWGGAQYPRMQILTIEELLNGKRIEYPGRQDPHANVTLKRAPRAKMAAANPSRISLLDMACAQIPDDIPDDGEAE